MGDLKDKNSVSTRLQGPEKNIVIYIENIINVFIACHKLKGLTQDAFEIKRRV